MEQSCIMYVSCPQQAWDLSIELFHKITRVVFARPTQTTASDRLFVQKVYFYCRHSINLLKPGFVHSEFFYLYLYYILVAAVVQVLSGVGVALSLTTTT